MASSSQLKPGEEGKIIARVDTEGRVGLITKTVKIFTNDPKRPRVMLVLKARIQ